MPKKILKLKNGEDMIITTPDAEQREEISLDNIEKAISKWYQITQSCMKMLLELKNDKKLSRNQAVTFNKNLKEFGWYEQAKSKNGLVEEPLDIDCPYVMLQQEFGIEKMNFKRRKKVFDGIEKVLNKRMVKFKEEEKEKSLLFETGGIGNLYAEYESISQQAKADIEEIEVLKSRKDALCDDMRKNVGIFKRDAIFDPFVEMYIDRAIALGYSAGLNANTTRILREMKQNNSSDNSFQG